MTIISNLCCLCGYALLPGVLLSLVARIPPLRAWARAQRNHRLTVILGLMLAALVLMYVGATRFEAESTYLQEIAFGGELDDATNESLREYEDNHRVIRNELWRRLLRPPAQRADCYARDDDTCDLTDRFIAQYEEDSEMEFGSPEVYGGTLALTIFTGLIAGGLTWWHTRRPLERPDWQFPPDSDDEPKKEFRPSARR
ncbi:MAG: hypothetical protein GYB65_22640 [Chloroflexi bacterium]|nr:hypothetical protein [Chloroflexota bacterium]